jgi:asparaginyl-tRNA synthetase
MKREKIKLLLAGSNVGKDIVAKGWVRTKRDNKSIVFIALNDGSTIKNIQIVADPSKFDEKLMRDVTTGSCISVKGKLVESHGKGQDVEIHAETIELYGKADTETYPLQKRDIQWSLCARLPI